ncbi:MAG: sodium:solute symporter [Cryomorphaceae bacterium]|nr:sodium:solute symporter [Flavobacteriales bacterium]
MFRGSPSIRHASELKRQCYFFKSQKDGQSYYLGGKSFGWFPLTLSTAATQLSAISFISAPAFVGFKEGGGMKWLTFELGVPLAMIFLMIFLIPALYKANILSIYSFLERRFGPTSRTLISVVFQLSRAFATSVMVYAVALILEGVMGFPLYITILIIGLVTTVYSYQGGMKAVVYGDVIQMLLLFGGLIVSTFLALHYIGGWNAFTANLDVNRLTVIDFGSIGLTEGDQFGFWPMLLGGFFLYASYYGTDQTQVQRLLSAKNMKTVQKTLLFNGLIRFPITFFYCLMGLIIGTMVLTTPEFLAAIPADKPDLMIPVFIRDYLPVGVKGLLIVAVLSAAMSSASSAINSIGATTMEDVVNRKKRLDDKAYVRSSRLVSVFWGVVCTALAFFVGDIADTVIEAINKIGSVFYGPIFATFISAALIKRINGAGANAGLIAGVAVNVYLWLRVPELFWFWWNLTGAVVSIAVALVVSKAYSDQDTFSLDHNWKETNWKYVFILLGFFAFMVVFDMLLPYFF